MLGPERPGRTSRHPGSRPAERLRAGDLLHSPGRERRLGPPWWDHRGRRRV